MGLSYAQLEFLRLAEDLRSGKYRIFAQMSDADAYMLEEFSGGGVTAEEVQLLRNAQGASPPQLGGGKGGGGGGGGGGGRLPPGPDPEPGPEPEPVIDDDEEADRGKNKKWYVAAVKAVCAKVDWKYSGNKLLTLSAAAEAAGQTKLARFLKFAAAFCNRCADVCGIVDTLPIGELNCVLQGSIEMDVGRKSWHEQILKHHAEDLALNALNVQLYDAAWYADSPGSAMPIIRAQPNYVDMISKGNSVSDVWTEIDGMNNNRADGEIYDEDDDEADHQSEIDAAISNAAALGGALSQAVIDAFTK